MWGPGSASNDARVVVEGKLLVVSASTTTSVPARNVGSVVSTGAGGTTLTEAEPLWPSLVAVIIAAPTATPVTTPLPFTVATAVLLVAHVTTRPLNGLPVASFGVAVSCTVCPTGTLADAGLTATEATGTMATV